MRKYLSIFLISFMGMSSQLFAANPTITSASVSGLTITLTTGSTLNSFSPSQLMGKFTVTVNGTTATLQESLTKLNTAKNSVILTLKSSVNYGDVISVSYTGTAIKDNTGNLLLPFSNFNVPNGSSTPSVNGYLENFNDNVLTGWGNDATNDFSFSETNQELVVTTSNATSGYTPFVYSIPSNVDMTSNATVTVSIKTTSTLSLRVDIQDVNGYTTNATPIIKTIAIDGIYATYTFDFTGKFSQTSPTATVDKTKINKVLFYTNAGSTFSGSFTMDDLTIGNVPIPATSVSVTPITSSISVNGNTTITATVLPTTATNRLVTWSSSDANIANVGTNGVVTGNKIGQAIITATSSDNVTLTATATITVTAPVTNKVNLGLELDTANGLKTNAVVGLQNGQYSKVDSTTFATAISSAQTVYNDALATQATIDYAASTLQTAIKTFKSKAIVINKTALSSLITNASSTKGSATVGTQPGQYSQTSIDALTSAITTAQTVLNDATSIQTDIDAAVTALNSALTTFTASVVPVDKKALTSLIATATSMYVYAQIGTQDGQYSQGAVDSLSSATADAQTIANNSKDQATVNAAVVTLQAAIDLFTSRVHSTGVIKTTLQTKIASANSVKSAAVIGTHVGEYAQADYNTFVTAISNAQYVYTNSTTQSTINTAVTTLQTAIDAFKLTAVPSPNKSVLSAEITTAQNLVGSAKAGSAIGQYPQSAIDALNAEITNAQSYISSSSANQSEVNAEILVLKSAEVTFSNSINTSTVDFSLLNSAIDSATILSNITVGTAVGNVPQASMTALKNALIYAKSVSSNASSTQSDVNSALSTLETAISSINQSIILAVVDKSALNNEITKAQNVVKNAIPGNSVGQYPQSAINTLNAEITTALYIIANTSAIQSDVDAEILALKNAELSFNNSINTSTVNFSLLNAAIDSATVLSKTTVGTAIGNVPQSSMTSLSSVLTSAKTTASNVNASQTDVNSVLALLETEITTFNQSKIIAVVDKSALNSEITKAQAAVKAANPGNAVGQYPQAAIDAFTAEILIASTLSSNTLATQTDVDAETQKITNAIKYFASSINTSVTNFVVLNADIDSATALTKTAIGTAVGNVSQSSIATLSAAIADAKLVASNVSSTQTQVNTAAATLQTAIIAFVVTIVPKPSKTALNTAISNANKSLSTAVAGNANGQYPQAAIDALNAELKNANSILSSSSANQVEVDAETAALTSAIQDFTKSVNTSVTNFTVLQSAIDSATVLTQLTVGTAVGNVPQSSISALNAALTTAKSVASNSSSTQTQVNEAALAIQTAISTFTKTIVPKSNKALLSSEISTANNTVTKAVVGNAVGQYPQLAIDALNKAINNANIVLSSSSANQSEVDAATQILKTAVQDFAKTVNTIKTNFTVLTTAIDSATKLSKTIVGTANGNVPQKSIDDITAAITLANTTAKNTSATQTDVNSAASTLASAIKAFNATVIKVVIDFSQLNKAIDSASTLSKTAVGTAIGNVPQKSIDDLNVAINKAKAELINSSATQTTVDNSTSALNSAILTFNGTIIKTAIIIEDEISLSASPIPFDETLTVKSKGMNIKSIVVYAITGELIYSESVSSESVQISTSNLPNGFYLVLAKMSNGESKVIKVIK